MLYPIYTMRSPYLTALLLLTLLVTVSLVHRRWVDRRREARTLIESAERTLALPRPQPPTVVL